LSINEVDLYDNYNAVDAIYNTFGPQGPNSIRGQQIMYYVRTHLEELRD